VWLLINVTMPSVHSQRGWVVHIATGGPSKANSIPLLVIVQRHQSKSAMQDLVSGLLPDTFCSPRIQKWTTDLRSVRETGNFCAILMRSSCRIFLPRDDRCSISTPFPPEPYSSNVTVDEAFVCRARMLFCGPRYDGPSDGSTNISGPRS
jgi:hypothetical protein